MYRIACIRIAICIETHPLRWRGNGRLSRRTWNYREVLTVGEAGSGVLWLGARTVDSGLVVRCCLLVGYVVVEC
jgi:hypothetical protein